MGESMKKLSCKTFLHWYFTVFIWNVDNVSYEHCIIFG